MSQPPDEPKSKDDAADADALERKAGDRVSRFKLERVLGKGAMGAVWLAQDTALRRPVAIKLMPFHIEDEEKKVHVDQFVREARSAAQIVHPHIVQIFEVGVSLGQPFIAMEVVDGGNLQDLVKRKGPMEYHRAAELIAQAAEGLAHAHELGILHRDIKPANLMLTRRGHCKLGDFGVAVMDDPEDDFKLPWAVVGTPYYMSPEAARGHSTVQSDIFALGGVLWYLLTAKPPFELKRPKDVFRVHKDILLRDLRQLRPDVPEAMVEAVEQALAAKPSERHASADVFAEALKPFADPHAKPVPPPPPPEPEVDPDMAELAAASLEASRGGTTIGGTRLGIEGTEYRRRPSNVWPLVGVCIAAVLMLTALVVVIVIALSGS